MAVFFEYEENTGRFNMDFDEKLLNDYIEKGQKGAVLRFYGWNPPCVSLGRNQRKEEINLDFCKKNNIDVVRRITGGRALLHHKEITYAFVCAVDFLENGQSIAASYKEISGALVSGMKKFGVEIEFSQNQNIRIKEEFCMNLNTGADLSCQGKKFIGSAQVRKQGCILQHGSILLDVDKNLLEGVFGKKIDEEKVIWLNKIKKNYDKQELLNSLYCGFEEKFNENFSQNNKFLV